MCNSFICDVADWLFLIGISWLGLLTLVAATILFWQLITTMLEDFKNDE